jgi:putative ABC transport system permease protein
MSMRTPAQIATVTAMNLRNLPSRASTAAVAMVGIAGVVAVMLGVLSIREGFRKTLETTGSPDVALVLRAGSNSEMSSIIFKDSVGVIEQAPGVAQDASGKLVSPEAYVVVDVPKRTTNTTANVPLRGVNADALRVHKKVHIVDGRMFTPGLNELIVGRGAAGQFSGLDVGSSVKWGRTTWNVVGIFAADGGLPESEIWADLRTVQDAYNRQSVQTVRVNLESPEAFQAFKDALTSDPRLEVSVERERDFYAAQSKYISFFAQIFGGILAFLMGLGAVFGAILTMYSAVAARTREIATLRALGFGALPIIVSVLAEALLLGLIGGIVGGLIALLWFNGMQTTTLNWQSFSQVTFAFAITPALLVTGITYALLLGLVGGMLPSVRAARLPITQALREM